MLLNKDYEHTAEESKYPFNFMYGPRDAFPGIHWVKLHKVDISVNHNWFNASTFVWSELMNYGILKQRSLDSS